jgi:hypothetical protein
MDDHEFNKYITNMKKNLTLSQSVGIIGTFFIFFQNYHFAFHISTTIIPL